jgi:hypothetical protein
VPPFPCTFKANFSCDVVRCETFFNCILRGFMFMSEKIIGFGCSHGTKSVVRSPGHCGLRRIDIFSSGRSGGVGGGEGSTTVLIDWTEAIRVGRVRMGTVTQHATQLAVHSGLAVAPPCRYSGWQKMWYLQPLRRSSNRTSTSTSVQRKGRRHSPPISVDGKCRAHEWWRWRTLYRVSSPANYTFRSSTLLGLKD